MGFWSKQGSPAHELYLHIFPATAWNIDTKLSMKKIDYYYYQ